MKVRAATLWTAMGLGVAVIPVFAVTAHAAISYECPLMNNVTCSDPLTGTVTGDATAGSDGFAFNLSGDGSGGFVTVAGSSQIDMTRFPISFTVQVKGVGVPSTAVGDYDVVRGTPSGNWKIEVVARNQRTTVRATCFFKGTQSKGMVAGTPDLTKLQSTWTTITCTNTGSAIEISVDGVVSKKAVSTGAIPNPGPLLIGAKDTSGGDQFSGYARSVGVTVPSS